MGSGPDPKSQKNCHFHQNGKVHNTAKTTALTETCEIYKVATRETRIRRYTNIRTYQYFYVYVERLVVFRNNETNQCYLLTWPKQQTATSRT